MGVNSHFSVRYFKMRYSELKAIIEGKSFKRNQEDDANDKKKQDKQRRDAREEKKNQPVEEGKSFKRNKDEDADDKKKQDKQRRDSRDDKKNQPVEESVQTLKAKVEKLSKDYANCDDFPTARHELKAELEKAKKELANAEALEEGKSFKRNKDEDADKKKKDDQQRRGDRKREPVEESSDIKKGAFHKWLGKPEDEKITAADIDKGLKSKDAHVRKMAQFAKNMEESVEVEEGKSFKRNDDDKGNVKQKRKEDQKRREDRDGKKNQPVDEGKSFKRNKDEDADDKKKQDKQKRDNQKGKQDRTDESRTTFEGKSFKRNKDDDADDKKKQDQNRRKEREDKRERTDESVSPSSILMLQDHGYDVEFIPPHFRNNGDMDEQYAVTYTGESSMHPDVIGKAYDKESAWDIAMEHFKIHGGMTASVGLELGESEENLDEASDVSFNDAKAQMPEVKHRLSKMSGFHPDYVKTKALHDKLQDRLARNGNSGDDELDEDALQVGDHIAYTFAHSSPPTIYNGVIKSIKGDQIQIQWDEENGHYAGPSNGDLQANGIHGDVYNTHWAKKIGTNEAAKDCGNELDEADISFNDAKAQMPEIKQRLSKMSGFHPDYVKTKALHDKLQDRLARNGSDELDESDETNFVHPEGGRYGFDNQPDGCLYTDGHKVFKGPRINSYAESNLESSQDNLFAHLKDLIQRGKVVEHDDELDEADDNMKSYEEVRDCMMKLFKQEATDPSVKDTPEFHACWKAMREHGISLPHMAMMRSKAQRSDLEEADEDCDSWCIVAGTGKVVAGPFSSQEEASGHIKYPGEHAKRGTPKSLSLRSESYVSDTSGYGGDSMDVCEDDEEHDHEVGEDVCVCAGKYKGMEGKVIKIGPGPYKVVQLKGGKQVRLENSEMKCAASESYVSGDTTSESDDVIEDLNMEDFVVPRDEAKGLADEVETKKDGKPISSSEIERMKQLAGLNKI